METKELFKELLDSIKLGVRDEALVSRLQWINDTERLSRAQLVQGCAYILYLCRSLVYNPFIREVLSGASRRELMTASDIDKFNSLPNTVDIYHVVEFGSKRYGTEDGIVDKARCSFLHTWTFDLKDAMRLSICKPGGKPTDVFKGGNGTILYSRIPKADILVATWEQQPVLGEMSDVLLFPDKLRKVYRISIANPFMLSLPDDALLREVKDRARGMRHKGIVSALRRWLHIGS